jgi:DNA-binding NarL/FixJ family response regulator
MGRQVLLVDDEPDIVELLTVLFTDDERCTGVRGVGDLDCVLTVADKDRPDTIVIDLMFGHRTCAEILPDLRSSCPQSQIIVFTSSERTARAENVLALGADAIRQKVSVSFDELVDEALSA